MKNKKKKSILIKLLMIALIVMCIALCSGFIWINNCIKDIKNIDLSLDDSADICYLIDAEGNEKELTNKLITPINIDMLNDYTIDAFISIEDKDFFKHNGINYKRIIKSMLDNLFAKKVVSGGSTITQQLVKNKYLSSEQTYERKLKEIYLAKKIEKNYNKAKILESYLNEIYFGHGAYGIENASKRYFSKSASELNLNESCVLAAVINSPATYSPINKKNNCIKRRNLILKEMLEDKKITKEEYSKTITEDIILNTSNLPDNNHDTYDIFAINEAAKILGVSCNDIYKGGYKIHTGKSTTNQTMLDTIINDDKYYHKNSNGKIADSLSMIIDNDTNMVSAISGRSIYNLYDLERQPGSLIKPVLVYAPAIEEGLINSATEIFDGNIDFSGYAPSNVGGISNDYVSIEDAVAKSLNIPAVKVCNMVGLDKCKKYAEKAGLKFDKKDNGLSLALGGTTNGFTLQNILDAYSPYIFKGKFKNSNIINCIKSNNNLTLFNKKMSVNSVFNDDTAYIMTDILKKSTKVGTSKKLSNIAYDIAGKTGTVAVPNTNFNTDVYSLAYTTEHRFAVWLGNYSMDKKYHLEGCNNGGTFATEIVKEISNSLYKNTPPPDFIKPDSVGLYNIDLTKLNNEHKVYINDNLPDRYTKTVLLSKRYLPEKTNTNFIDKIDLSVSSAHGKNIILFNTESYCKYEIHRVINHKDEVIYKIKNSDEKISFEDKNIVDGNLYEYYVIGINTISKNKFNSNRIKVIGKSANKDDTILNYDWLFT